MYKEIKKVLTCLLLIFLSLKIFSQESRDYADYKDWQISSEKSNFVQLWEETELNFNSYTASEYKERIELISDSLKKEIEEQKTFEYESSMKMLTDNLFELLEELKESAGKSHREVSLCRIQTNLAVINYVNLRANIMKNNTKTIFFLLLVLFVILVIFILSTTVFALRLRKSKKNEKNTSDFNQKIIEAQENERKRISLELHDTIAQNLRAIQLLTSQAFSSEKNKNEISELKNQVLDLESKSIIDIRTLCYNLTPPDLDRKDLRSALSHFCSTFTRDTKIECSLVITEDCDFSVYSSESQLNIFRLVQEALNNAAKHSQAEEITVVVRKDILKENSQLRILITDDGTGFNLESASFLDSHFGLKGMKERSKFLGGTLEINTAPGEGTEVKIIIPYKEK